MLPLDYLFSPWKNINTQDCFCLASFFVFSRRARDVFCTLGCFFPLNLQRTWKNALLVCWFFGLHQRLQGLSVNVWTSAWLRHWTIISFFFASRLCLGERSGRCNEYIALAAIFWRRGVFSFPQFLEITVPRSSKRGFHVATSASIRACSDIKSFKLEFGNFYRL